WRVVRPACWLSRFGVVDAPDPRPIRAFSGVRAIEACPPGAGHALCLHRHFETQQLAAFEQWRDRRDQLWPAEVFFDHQPWALEARLRREFSVAGKAVLFLPVGLEGLAAADLIDERHAVAVTADDQSKRNLSQPAANH